MSRESLWVELVGDIVIARLRGAATQELLTEAHRRVATILRDAGRRSVLYDALEMEAPTVDTAYDVIEPTRAVAQLAGKMGIVVTNSRIAYLARLAFGDGNYRVFYNDMSSALAWLSPRPPDEAPEAGNAG
ncbi:MAG: hypothetical protein WA208_03550 [Thermoanaerobaculia bacterium]